MFSSKEFANFFKNDLSFIIGGVYGLSQEVRDKADKIISLSKMTLTHMMARAMLVEQIYRSHTILSNHPYHK